MTLAAAVAVAALVFVAPAGATTIGSTATSITGGCGSDVVAWNTSPSVAVPAGGGVITSVATNSPETGGHISMKVFRINGSKATVIATTPSIAVMAGTNTVALRVAVAAGDVLGMYTPDGADCGVAGGSADVFQPVGGDPAVGADITPNGSAPATIAVSANFEPDVDKDGFGDETEDSCPTDPAIHTGPCITDLSATQSVTPTTIGIGDVAVATVTLANGSTGLAQGVTATAKVTPGLQVVSMIPGNGCTFSPDLSCTFGNLAGGASTVAAIVVRGVTTGAQTLSTSAGPLASDPSTANNTATTAITVEKRVTARCNVPSLKGLTKAVAKRLLTAAGCKLGKAKSKKAKSGKKGTVIKQSPKAGSKLAPGAKVAVTLKK